jgi:hemin uptake protein HemP
MARCSLNRRYVFWRVRGDQFLTRGRARSHNSAALLQPVGGNRIEHVCALGPLRVTGRGDVILKTRRRN